MCYSLWYNATTMLPAPATSWVHYTTNCNTQSSVPKDGQNNCPKYVELTGIINKLLLLHLVGCLYYLYFFIQGYIQKFQDSTCKKKFGYLGC